MNEHKALYNLEQLKQSVHHDGEFLILMLVTFIETNTESLLKMGTAVQTQDWKSVGEIAHKMLSSYRHLKIESLLPTLSSLETLIWNQSTQSNIEDDYTDLKVNSELIFAKLNEEIDFLKKA